MIPQILINGLMSGMIYILFALGLTLLFSIMRILNFAHGTLYMLAAYATYYISVEAGLNYWVAVILATLLMALFGLLLEAVVFRRFHGIVVPAVIASIGVSLALQQGALIVFGFFPKSMPSIVKGSLEVGAILMPYDRLVVIIIGFSLVAGLFFFIQKHRLGIALRAVAEDQEMAKVQGININKISYLAMGIGVGLAGMAGALIGPVYTVETSMGHFMLMKGINIIILGGLGSIPGCIVAGLLLGLIDSFSITILGYGGNIVAFLLLIVIIIFRPRGFFGREEQH